MPVNSSTQDTESGGLLRVPSHSWLQTETWSLKKNLKKGRNGRERKGKEEKRKERLQENVLPNPFYYSQGYHMSESPPRHETSWRGQAGRRRNGKSMPSWCFRNWELVPEFYLKKKKITGFEENTRKYVGKVYLSLDKVTPLCFVLEGKVDSTFESPGSVGSITMTHCANHMLGAGTGICAAFQVLLNVWSLWGVRDKSIIPPSILCSTP